MRYVSWLLLCVLYAQSSSCYQICGRSKSTMALAPPKLIDCNNAASDPHAKVESIMATIFTKRQKPVVGKAYYCYKRTVTVMTFQNLILTTSREAPVYRTESVSVQDCKDMIAHSHRPNDTEVDDKWKKLEWNEDDGYWSTNNKLKLTYRYFATTPCTATNWVLEEGNIASFDGKELNSDFGNLQLCHVDRGICITPKGTVIWNAETMIQSECPYELKGDFKAARQGSLLVINTEQIALSFTKNVQPLYVHCINAEVYKADQGNVLVRMPKLLIEEKEKKEHAEEQNMFRHWASMLVTNINNNISGDRTEHLRTAFKEVEADPINAKLQYIEYRIDQQIHYDVTALYKQICILANRNIELLRRFLVADPTGGVRAMMQSDSYTAIWAGKALMVWMCKQVKPQKVYLSGMVDDVCYLYLPVKANGKLWFALPGTADLVPNSPAIPCDERIPFYETNENETEFFTEHGVKQVQHMETALLSLPKMFQEFEFFAFTATKFQQSYNWGTAISMLNHYVEKFGKREQQLDRMSKYLSDMAFSSSEFNDFINGTGRFLGHAVDTWGQTVQHSVTEMGGVVNTLLKGPFQAIFNALIIIAVVLFVAFLLYQFVIWRCYKNGVSGVNAKDE